MSHWRLKGCPKCSGDLCTEEDRRVGWQEVCLQCGYTIPLMTAKEMVDRIEKKLFKEVKV